MKKSDLIHVTIKIVGILLGYSAISQLITLITMLGYLGGPYSYFGIVISAFITCITLSIACYLLLRNAWKYTRLILKSEPELFDEEALPITLNKEELIYTFIVGLGLYLMAQYIPNAIANAYKVYSDTVNRDALSVKSGNAKTDLIIELLRITVGAMLIYGARQLSEFIIKLSLPGRAANHNPGKDVL